LEALPADVAVLQGDGAGLGVLELDPVEVVLVEGPVELDAGGVDGERVGQGAAGVDALEDVPVDEVNAAADGAFEVAVARLELQAVVRRPRDDRILRIERDALRLLLESLEALFHRLLLDPPRLLV